MKTGDIRQKLHNYLEVADDKKVKAIYTMMEEEIEESIIQYDEELKRTLNERQVAYKNSKEKTVTATESKKRIQKILKGRK